MKIAGTEQASQLSKILKIKETNFATRRNAMYVQLSPTCGAQSSPMLPGQAGQAGQPGQAGQAGQDSGEMYVLEALGFSVCFRKHFRDVKTLPRTQIR